MKGAEKRRSEQRGRSRSRTQEELRGSCERREERVNESETKGKTSE